ncbi:MAG: hypothetical protein GTO51_09855 [Candidatus Latescibacteria bacterium]|nr:hypothetical protein [Candidatus Latescibacterota bacterium]NIM66272.1 hypothetical protein [Candidatus Latescibacterota bacterium]NIO02753.1 hypothetical protein [Candidatus Latescibacterota bacterium]NIO29888.1 hypothetical protein [Candidatus Latescibacterota bacterium]NIO57502.1 hypothetical protein [Candidatus Latescibacterota bacterium]
MNRRFKIWLGFAILVTIAIFLAGQSYGFRDKKDFGLDKKSIKKPKTGSFSVAGMFMGSIKGRITIGGREILITPKTKVYVPGEGLKRPGYFASEASLFVCGTMSRGMPVATYVVVRPSHSQKGFTNRSRKDSPYIIRKGANPNTGEYAADVPS